MTTNIGNLFKLMPRSFQIISAIAVGSILLIIIGIIIFEIRDAWKDRKY